LELRLQKEGECSKFETWKIPKYLTNIGSDLDAELGGDDEMDWNYDSDDFEHLPKISSSLILLEEIHHCRAPTQVKSTNGSKISCACGKLGSKCQRLPMQPRILHRVSNPFHGFKGHGKIGVYYTSEQYTELRHQENTKMNVLVASQQDKILVGNEVAAEFEKEACVSLGSSVEVIEAEDSALDRPSMNTARTPNEIQASLEATTDSHKKSRSKQSKSSKSDEESNSIPYYPFIDPSGCRWILQDFDQVYLYLDTS
jgi:hypothetical protein